MMYPVKIKSNQPPNVLEIRWDPNNTCNYSCRYCFPGANAGTHKTSEDIDLLVTNFRHLFNQYANQLDKNQFHLIIGGGEPTLWKNFGVFLLKIKEQHNVYATVISNGSRTLRWWKEYAPYIDNAVLSLHVEQTDLDHHISVADILYEQGKKVTVGVLMDPKCWDKCVDTIEYMKKHSKYPWFIEAKTVVDTSILSIKYTENQIKYLKTEIKRMPNFLWFIKNIKLLIKGVVKRYKSVATMNDGGKMFARSSTYVTNKYTNFKGWDCNIGVESVYVNWGGDITGACGQTLFNLDASFNILNVNFKTQFNPQLASTTCQMSTCNCLPETHVSKVIKFSLVNGMSAAQVQKLRSHVTGSLGATKLS